MISTRKNREDKERSKKALEILNDNDPDCGPNHGFDPSEVDSKASDALRQFLEKAENDLSIVNVPIPTEEELDKMDKEVIYIDGADKYPGGAQKLADLLKKYSKSKSKFLKQPRKSNHIVDFT